MIESWIGMPTLRAFRFAATIAPEPFVESVIERWTGMTKEGILIIEVPGSHILKAKWNIPREVLEVEIETKVMGRSVVFVMTAEIAAN